jgi:alcohol dehydrogenase class IV
MNQIILSGAGSSVQIEGILNDIGSRKFLLVCDDSYQYLSNREILENIQIPNVRFSDFTPNPLYEQVVQGVDVFNAQSCDAIVAVGGGSTMDVAKCIKLYCKMDRSVNFLRQEAKDTGIPLLAVPTTAGTGSESTRYAVIYYGGQKQSITHESILSDYAILDSSLLHSLPLYQKKCTMLDALCQGIESWWSVNSTEESIAYSKQAVNLIICNWETYIFENAEAAAEQIMLAANYAGRAISVAQTTAPHAMSYKITSMYKLPHGHAVALCLPEVWRYMTEHLDKCVDMRGADYLDGVFTAIRREMGCAAIKDAITYFEDMMCKLDMPSVPQCSGDDIDVLTNSVNPIRLKNNPIELDTAVIRAIYEAVFRK